MRIYRLTSDGKKWPPALENGFFAPGVILDYDAEGHIVGLEVLRARQHLSKDTLIAAE